MAQQVLEERHRHQFSCCQIPAAIFLLMLTWKLLTYQFFSTCICCRHFSDFKWNRKFILNIFTTIVLLCSWKKRYESEDVTYLRLFSCPFVTYLILTKLFQFFRSFSELPLGCFMTSRQTGTYTVLERLWSFRFTVNPEWPAMNLQGVWSFLAR